VVYRLLTLVLSPLAWWGRLRVAGLELVPESGPLLVVPNHDSQMDPIMIALALRRHRSLRFLGRAELWRNRLLSWLLYAAHQIPIERGAQDAGALDEAIGSLRGGRRSASFPRAGSRAGNRCAPGPAFRASPPPVRRRGSSSARSPVPPTSCASRGARV
jgi:1-acyl-sn-glycerol-3-phosphate acyltransferase